MRPMPQLLRKWTQWELGCDLLLRCDWNSWTLSVRYRNNDARTFEFAFAKFNTSSRRERLEMNPETPSFVMGGLDIVAKAEGLEALIKETNLDAPATWTDEYAKDAFLSVLKRMNHR